MIGTHSPFYASVHDPKQRGGFEHICLQDSSEEERQPVVSQVGLVHHALPLFQYPILLVSAVFSTILS